MSTKQRKARVTVNVPADVLEVWQTAAELQGMSTSKLICEWMGEMVPGLRDVAKLHAAFQEADRAQKSALRAAILDAADSADGVVRDVWEPVRQTITETAEDDVE